MFAVCHCHVTARLGAIKCRDSDGFCHPVGGACRTAAQVPMRMHRRGVTLVIGIPAMVPRISILPAPSWSDQIISKPPVKF